MTITEKIKTIDQKIKQNIAQYDLDRQTAKVLALSSGNVTKYEFLTSKDVLAEKYLLQKAATMKRLEYSPLDKELKAQTDIAKKQYQKLDNTYEFDRIQKNKNKNKTKTKSTTKKYNRSNLIYSIKYSFYEYYSINFNSLSFTSKYKVLTSFCNELNNFYSLKPQKESTKEKKRLCIIMLQKYIMSN